MIQKAELKTNYSSSVELYLVVGEERFELSSIGPNQVTLRESGIELDRRQATILMIVDGAKREWDVLLETGVVPFDLTIPIVNLK